MAHTVVETPLDMAPRHVRRLAALDGASSAAIAEAISLWPLGVRLFLTAHNVIDYNAGADGAPTHGSIGADDVEAAASRGESLDFGITPFGLGVIHDCAQWARVHDDGGDPATSEELEEIQPPEYARSS